MDQPTMIYSNVPDSGISHADYWYKIVDGSEVEAFIRDGWVENPAELADKPKKRGPKPKVKEDVNRD